MRKEREKPEFEITDRGFTIKAWYLEDEGAIERTSLVKISKNGELIMYFLYPSYKVWNLAAHFSDIVDSEIAGDGIGFAIANSFS